METDRCGFTGGSLSFTLILDLSMYIFFQVVVFGTIIYFLYLLFKKLLNKSVGEFCSFLLNETKELIDVEVRFYGRERDSTDEMEGL